MERDDTAQGVERVTVDLSVVEDFCATFTTHDDVETVASLIGGVPLTVDYRSPEALSPSTATILRWGDGILIAHPYYGDECARQEVMSALSVPRCARPYSTWRSPAWMPTKLFPG